MRKRCWVAVGIGLLLAGCSGGTPGGAASGDTETAVPIAAAPTDPAGGPLTGPLPAQGAAAGTRCGVERWNVKVGNDPAAKQVNRTPQQSNIATLVGLHGGRPFSPDPTARITPLEFQVDTVQATITGYKVEADGDVHLVIVDGAQHMIAEIPNPACVGAASPFLAGITATRSAWDRAHPAQAGGGLTKVNLPVTISGVVFFDKIHGQTGVASNGVELHPVLSIQ